MDCGLYNERQRMRSEERYGRSKDIGRMRRGHAGRMVVMTFVVCLSLFSANVMAQDRSELREELQRLSERLEYYPDSVDLRLRKAACNIELDEWEYAKNEYDYILDRDPLNVSALFYRAFVNGKLNRYTFARVDYEKLLSVVHRNFEAQLGLALINQKDMHYTEAMDQINILIEQYPDNALAYAVRAGMENERGMLEPAEYDYTTALELDPDNKDYLLNRADIRLTLCKYNEARQDLDRLVALGTQRAALNDFYKRIKK